MKEPKTYEERHGPVSPDTLKRCMSCGDDKPVTQFHKGKYNLYGVQHVCKDCTRERIRHVHWRRTYGLSDGDYEERLKAQGGGCALCDVPDAEATWAGKPTRLAVDHCHVSGEVRGLVCHRCNQRLSMIDGPDWSQWMDRAQVYLGR